jgi:acetyltransferase-like isoleucine patch superfamily enzyme
MAAPSQQPSRPPLTLAPTTHLDPGAYIRGTHAITIGEHALILPRAQLVATRGPLIIGDKCVISTKCIVGGPVVASSSTEASGSGKRSTPHLDQGTETDDEDPVKTVIGANVYVHPGVHVHAGATVEDGVLVESGVTIVTGVTIGGHSKLCAGITVDRDIEPWTVVQGNGELQRRKMKAGRTASDLDNPAELLERLRVKAMDTEREGTVMALRSAQRANLAKKK